MKKIITILIILALTLSITACDNATQDDVAAIENTVADLKTRIEALENELNEANSELIRLRDELEELKAPDPDAPELDELLFGKWAEITDGIRFFSDNKGVVYESGVQTAFTWTTDSPNLSGLLTMTFYEDEPLWFGETEVQFYYDIFNNNIELEEANERATFAYDRSDAIHAAHSSGFDDESPLVGTWADLYIVTFKDNATGTIRSSDDNIDFDWYIEDGALFYAIDGGLYDETAYSVSSNGATLTCEINGNSGTLIKIE
ncbi:MAG: hypothetical protein FWG45_00915 [Oscillospiraceae bacterium]|nr:hypothetical protein [Oscillospiraceae bacterium]